MASGFQPTRLRVWRFPKPALVDTITVFTQEQTALLVFARNLTVRNVKTGKDLDCGSRR